jgi:NRPS condensation-like uncharacterized protein
MNSTMEYNNYSLRNLVEQLFVLGQQSMIVENTLHCIMMELPELNLDLHNDALRRADECNRLIERHVLEKERIAAELSSRIAITLISRGQQTSDEVSFFQRRQK